MQRPPAAPYQPALSKWGHSWRFVAMLIISAAAFAELGTSVWDSHRWVIPIDLSLGAVSYVAVHFRRRWPFAVAVLLTIVSSFSASAGGPSALAAVSLATRRIWAEVIGIGLLNLVSIQIYALTYPMVTPDSKWWIDLPTTAIVVAGLLGWGMFIGSRRELVWTLQQRAERAEAEQELRATLARDNERTRIAREMHDVLGHRISQISMHAGALTYRTDLDATALREGIEDINEKAQEALTDLRSVLGVLRDSETGAILNRPQPTHADVSDLVDEATEAGMRIALNDTIVGGPVPAALGRTLYRIAQEGITNASKHAPGTTLAIRLAGSPELGVEFELRNPPGFTNGSGPGGGLGLVGLAERAALAGGRLDHQVSAEAFIVRGWLPWQAGAAT